MQWTMLHQDLTVLRVVNGMVGLGGDLFVYGGRKPVGDGELEALSDVLVARAKGGVVNQPWKRLSISEPPPPLSRLLIWVPGREHNAPMSAAAMALQDSLAGFTGAFTVDPHLIMWLSAAAVLLAKPPSRL